jgi:putative ABC transport system permease protein
VNVTNVFSYAFSAIKLRKLRAGLTILGVVIGIAAIVALLSLSQGFQSSITAQFEQGFATNTLMVSTQGFGPMQAPSDITLYVNDTVPIADLDQVESAMAVIQKTGYLQVGEDSLAVAITGVDFETYALIYSSSFVADSGSIPASPANDTVVIGYRVGNPSDDTTFSQVGDTVELLWTTRDGYTLSNASYAGTVTAVLAEIGGFGIGGPSDTGVYIPLAQAQRFFDTDKASRLVVQLADSDDATIDRVSEGVQALYSGQVQVTAPTAMLNIITGAFTTIELFLAGIAGISLLVAGIGIMNIMIVSLMERTREIGILKALGMKNRAVLSIFVSESVIIGVIGAVLGIALGWGLAIGATGFLAGFSGGGGAGFGPNAGAMSLSITPTLTLPVLLGAFAFGLVVSVLFALYPAWRASRLRPVEALRYE